MAHKKWYEKGWIHDNIAKPVADFIKENGVYVGYSSNNGVYVDTISNHTGQPATGSTSSKPTAYSRTTAKTASDIAQGGMTKDEVEDFNLKHPNETALRRY